VLPAQARSGSPAIWREEPAGFATRKPITEFGLQIPRADFDSLSFDVLLKIAHRELKPPGDSVVCEPVLFGQSIDVSFCGLQIFGGLVDAEKPLS